MAAGRNRGKPKIKADSKALLELGQSAREGKVLGIGLCNSNPSGCYDIAKEIGSKLHNIPIVKVQCVVDPTIDPRVALLSSMFGEPVPCSYEFLDQPPQFNTKCDTVFFTGCGMDSSSMPAILNILSQQYQFTNIRYVYHISPPHHPENMLAIQSDAEDAAEFFKSTPYQYRLLYSGIDINDLSNIGIPRYELKESKESEFKVPVECYGIIRHGDIETSLLGEDNTLEVEKYLNEYFRQVANAGKDSVTKPIMVIAIEILPPNRQRILEIAKLYAVDIDFCDKYPNYRLPQQNDFFQALSAMRDKKGIISFDGNSTQSLLQTLSFGASAIVFNPDDIWPEFYAQLVSLVPIEDQPTAKVIFGLSDKYELLKDRAKCQKIYELLHLEINKAHHKFDTFKEANLALMKKITPQKDMNAKKELPSNVGVITCHHVEPVVTDSESKLPLSLATSKNSLFTTLTQENTNALATAAQPNSVANPIEKLTNEKDAEPVKLIFQSFG